MPCTGRFNRTEKCDTNLWEKFESIICSTKFEERVYLEQRGEDDGRRQARHV